MKVSLIVLLLWFVVASASPKKNIADIKYDATCIVTLQDHIASRKLDVSCQTALFSSDKNYHVEDVFILRKDINLCFASDNSTAWRRGGIIGVSRGECAFDVKARNANILGYKGLVVVNTDETLFPIGSQDATYRSKIPVVLVNDSLWSNLESSISTCDAISPECRSINSENKKPFRIQLTYENAPRVSNVDSGAEHVIPYLGPILNVVLLLVFALFFNCSTDKANFIICAMIIIFVVMLRLSTLRILTHTADGSPAYNHNETDERIFEDWRQYRLPPEIIRQFRLAAENYGDRLFIHPPLFVYLSATLRYGLNIPLPIISIVYQAITMILTVLILREMFSSLDQKPSSRSGKRDVHAAAVWSLVCFSFCPIAGFISHKFWIDNCLMMTVAAAVLAHTKLCRYCAGQFVDIKNSSALGKTAELKWLDHLRVTRWCSIQGQALSGFIFGLLAMNCKITAAATLPFMACWSLLQRVRGAALVEAANEGVVASEGSGAPSTRLSLVVVFFDCSMDTLLHVVALSGGAALGHGPWVYLYWTTTGRLVPNAWPSAEMIQRSLFLQAAIAKPAHSYFSALVRFSPAHALGILFAMYSFFKAAKHIFLLFMNRAQPGTQLTNTDTETNTRTTIQNPKIIKGDSDSDDNDSLILSEEHKNMTTRTLRKQRGLSELTQALDSLAIFVLGLWPLAYLGGLTFIGYMGAGYQNRFLAPILPATAILAGLAIERAGPSGGALAALLVAYAAMHFLYYGLMFSPLYADLDDCVFDILAQILTTPFSAPPTQESFTATISYMRHFGLAKKVS